MPKYKPLFNFDPPATDDEVHDAALQFVRKVSGTTKPSKCNELAFEHAVSSITACARELLDSLETSQPPRDREEVAAKARAISGPVRVRELRHAREISIKPQVAYLTAFGPKRTISSFQVDDRYAPTSGHGRPADRHRLPNPQSEPGCYASEAYQAREGHVSDTTIWRRESPANR